MVTSGPNLLNFASKADLENRPNSMSKASIYNVVSVGNTNVVSVGNMFDKRRNIRSSHVATRKRAALIGQINNL